jgi:glycosyltransferase involved in cell wall biosynthesis
MRIGVDVRILVKPITGIGRYTLEMCRALSVIKNVSLHLYAPTPISASALLGLERAVVRSGSIDNSLLTLLWSESWLPFWAKKDEIDVFWGPAHRLPRCLPGNMARVITIHDLAWKYAADTMRPLSRLLDRYQMPFAVRASDEIVTGAQVISDSVSELFSIDADKFSIVPPGTHISLDPSPFSSLQQFGIDRPYFLFVGTIEPRKNLIRLLTAYSNLAQSVKDQAVLVIAGGEGWGGVNIHDAVDSLGLRGNVHLLGYVDEPSLVGLYANAQFLAMPSLYEGFGLPLIEAMAHGVPVLTSDNSSMPEVAGNAGLLVDARDVDSISDGLNQLITNKELRSRLAANAKINAERFSWDESAERVLAVFENAIAVRRSHLS